MAAEAQVVCHSINYIAILRFVKGVIEIHLAFSFLGACRNVYIRILDCLNASDELDAACTAQSVTDHGLCGVDGYILDVFLECILHCTCLEKIVVVS